MSLKVSGACQVYKIEDKGSYVTASLRTSKKDKKTDEWISEFYNARFVGKDKASAAKLSDKDKITLTSAILESNKGKDGRTYTSVIVFEFTSMAVEPYAETNSFVPVDDDDDLPF
jgi:hypothetical protein